MLFADEEARGAADGEGFAEGFHFGQLFFDRGRFHVGAHLRNVDAHSGGESVDVLFGQVVVRLEVHQRDVKLEILSLLAGREGGKGGGFADAAEDGQFLEHDADLAVILFRQCAHPVDRTFAIAAAVIEELDHRHLGVGRSDRKVAGMGIELAGVRGDGGLRGSSLRNLLLLGERDQRFLDDFRIFEDVLADDLFDLCLAGAASAGLRAGRQQGEGRHREKERAFSEEGRHEASVL